MTASSPFKILLLVLSLVVVALDQWTKRWVETTLSLHQHLEIIPGFLDFVHVQNNGVAFGLFANAASGAGYMLLTVLGAVAFIVVFIYYYRAPTHHRLVPLALALVLGGAVGNLIDRVRLGYVTDFIDVYVGSFHWWTFNVADSAITVGIVLLAFDGLVLHRDEPASD